jgi:hypothetical protein
MPLMKSIRQWTLLVCFFSVQLTYAVDFPEFASLPSHPEYPDPLTMMDGTKITSATEWFSKRRPELRELFQHYMYGYLPPKPQKTIVEEVLFTDATFLEGKATISESRLAFYGPELRHRQHVLLVLPNKRSTPAPVFLAMNFCGNHAIVKHPKVHIQEGWVYKSCGGAIDERATEAGRGTQAGDWNLDLILDRGYGFACFCSGDIDPDTPEFADGIEPAFYGPGQTGPKPDDAGTIAAWAWGFHRALDFLIDHHSQTVDAKRIISVGHSRNGKTALLAAAMDERIALAIPHQAGCGGTAPNRVAFDTGKVETIEKINERFPHWFCDNFAFFNKQPDKLPFDQHCLVALCAPRPVLFSNAVEDRWANPDCQFEMLKAADPVYRLLNAGGLEATEMPKPRQFVNSKLGYFLRPGTHSMNREDWGVFLDFADKQLGKP